MTIDAANINSIKIDINSMIRMSYINLNIIAFF